jgi:hypothetical protein
MVSWSLALNHEKLIGKRRIDPPVTKRRSDSDDHINEKERLK